MDLVALLLLLTGQASSNGIALDPGAGTVQPQSGGIPTSPPPPPPVPFPTLPPPNPHS